MYRFQPNTLIMNEKKYIKLYVKKTKNQCQYYKYKIFYKRLCLKQRLEKRMQQSTSVNQLQRWGYDIFGDSQADQVELQQLSK